MLHADEISSRREQARSLHAEMARRARRQISSYFSDIDQTSNFIN